MLLQFKKQGAGENEEINVGKNYASPRLTISKCYHVRDKILPEGRERNETTPLFITLPQPSIHSRLCFGHDPAPPFKGQLTGHVLLDASPQYLQAELGNLPFGLLVHTSADTHHTATIICPQICPPSLLFESPRAATVLTILHSPAVSTVTALVRCTKDPRAPWRPWYRRERAWLTLTCCCDVGKANEFICLSGFSLVKFEKYEI